MYSYIKGEFAAVGNNFVVIDVAGVGYKIMTSYTTLREMPPIGEVVKMHTYLAVREDAMELFGFAKDSDLEAFKLLISVSGVGSRVALAILSEFTSESFALCVVTKDSKSLTKASGVGAKLASRIILELTDKISNEQITASTQSESSQLGLNFTTGSDEAVSALIVLGYSRSEALKAVRSIDTTNMKIEDIIKAALKLMM